MEKAISKKTFVKTMKALEHLEEKMEAVDSAMSALCSDFNGFYIPEATSIPLNILSEALDDKDEWLQYFAYEQHWLNSYKHGDVELDGKPIDVSTWEKVYDFIMADKELAGEDDR